VVNTRDTGPGPLRTARGAGRLDFVEPPFVLEERRDWLPDDRDRELVELLLRVAPEARDAGGEDVRVAMRGRLRDRHSRHRDPTPVRPPPSPGVEPPSVRG
jgi:hypothetical protein